jgi:hypothetical protein
MTAGLLLSLPVELAKQAPVVATRSMAAAKARTAVLEVMIQSPVV